MAIDLTNILTEVDGLCAADKASINEAIFEKYIQDSDFAQNHEILTGVRANGIIPFMSSTPDYGYLKVSQGNCESNICEINTTSSAKKWNPVDYDCRLPICKQDLECDFRKFWDMNCKDFDNMEDAFMQFLVAKVQENQNASFWRIAYFDTSDNTDPLYAGIDGLFEQWLTLAPDGAANHIDIPENAEATVAGQLALAADRGYQVLKAMYDYAAVNNTDLLSQPGVYFAITPELAFNYLAYLRDNREINCCFSTTNGITETSFTIENLGYLGIPIKVAKEWSNIIRWQQTQSGATNLDNPHRVVLTYKENKPIGICDELSFRNFDMFYDKKDKQIYIDVTTSFDAKVIDANDFVIAI